MRVRASEWSGARVCLACADSVPHFTGYNICATDVDASQLSCSLSRMMHKICTDYPCVRLLSPIYMPLALFFGISISFIGTHCYCIEHASRVQAARRFLWPGCAPLLLFLRRLLSLTKQLNTKRMHTAHEVCFHGDVHGTIQLCLASMCAAGWISWWLLCCLCAEFWFHLCKQ